MTRAEVRSQERLFKFKFNMEFMGRPSRLRTANAQESSICAIEKHTLIVLKSLLGRIVVLRT